MLRQVYIIKQDDIIYKRIFGNALTDPEIEDISFKIRNMARKAKEKETSHIDFFNYRVSYDVELELNLIFIFVTGLVDDYFRSIKTQLSNFKEDFLKLFADSIEKEMLDYSKIDILNAIIDKMHRNLKPKIAVVGFSGVGKTTIKKLLKLDEIPLQHIPTISGDIATIKIGKLFFSLFDFAGQDQFKYLWKGFIKGSDAVLIITDSTLKNIEKSRFFLELKEKEAYYARSAIIGNKQDLPNVMNVKEIEKLLGLKTYPMIANRIENRDKMIQIITEILDMNIESNPLLDDLVETKQVTEEIELVINNEPLKKIGIPNDSISVGDSNGLRDLGLENRVLNAGKDLKNHLFENKEPDLKIIQKPTKSIILDSHIESVKKKMKEDIEDFNLKERLLGIIRVKKRVKINYVEKFLRISHEKIIGLIYDLVGSGQIEGEFNDDDTEFKLN